MKVLITGGAGFIGSYLIKKLFAENHEIVVYDLTSTASAKIADISDEIELIRGNVRDLPLLLNVLKKYEINYIVHLAVFLPEAAIRENPTKAIRVNLEGTNNVFEAAKIMDVKRVVYASSEAVKPLGPKEDAPVNPNTLYGACKVFNEVMGLHFFNHFKLDTIGLRFGFVYGPNGSPHMFPEEQTRKYGSQDAISRPWLPAVVARLVENIVAGKLAFIPFRDTVCGHWLYVKDSVSAIMSALSVETPKNRVFNIGGQRRTMGEAAEILKRLVPSASIEFGGWELPEALGGKPMPVLDNSAARKQLGYVAKYTLERGLEEYVKAVRENPPPL